MMRKNKKLTCSILVLLGLVLLAILVPILSPYTFESQDIDARNLGSSLAHLFGTDKFGRDIFTRVFYGMRISIIVGLLSTLVCLVLGMIVGVVAGYFGGVVDTILVEIMNVLSSIPSMLYVILIMMVFQSSIGAVIIGICIAGWINVAKVVRAETRRIKQLEYYMYAKTMGVSRGRILWNYLLKNEKDLIIVQAVLLVPKAIFTEAFLSFIGIGIAAPNASLGTLIQDAQSQISIYPMQIIYPVIAMVVLMACLQSVGYALEREATNK